MQVLFSSSARLVCLQLLISCVGATVTQAGENPATAAKPGTDVLILIDGEKLIGHFEGSQGAMVKFKSDLAGEITIDWSKVRTLQSPSQYAVLEKGSKARLRKDNSKVPQGQIEIADQQIVVKNGPESSETVAVANMTDVINEAAFEKAVARKPGPFEAWVGSATVGIALVEATQTSATYTSGISLARSVPTVPWLDPLSRTTFTFNSAYGRLTQPGTPSVKTEIYHASGERDRYLNPDLYLFGEAAFDHDFSQGLDLQQVYGGGLGWAVVKGASDQFDLKGELTYVNQEFQSAADNRKLFGSVFSEGYSHQFRRSIVLHEQLSISPGITDTHAYSAQGQGSLTIPMIKRLSLTLATADGFLNDPITGIPEELVPIHKRVDVYVSGQVSAQDSESYN